MSSVVIFTIIFNNNHNYAQCKREKLFSLSFGFARTDVARKSLAPGQQSAKTVTNHFDPVKNLRAHRVLRASPFRCGTDFSAREDLRRHADTPIRRYVPLSSVRDPSKPALALQASRTTTTTATRTIDPVGRIVSEKAIADTPIRPTPTRSSVLRARAPRSNPPAKF